MKNLCARGFTLVEVMISLFIFTIIASMAAGVARDKAQGHVTTSTATATIKAWPGSRPHQKAQARPAASRTPIRNGLAI